MYAIFRLPGFDCKPSKTIAYRFVRYYDRFIYDSYRILTIVSNRFVRINRTLLFARDIGGDCIGNVLLLLSACSCFFDPDVCGPNTHTHARTLQRTCVCVCVYVAINGLDCAMPAMPRTAALVHFRVDVLLGRLVKWQRKAHARTTDDLFLVFIIPIYGRKMCVLP